MYASNNSRDSEEAFERLAAHERDDEPFSDVELRLAGERSLLDIAGAPSDEEADAFARPSRRAATTDGMTSNRSPTGWTKRDVCLDTSSPST
jgi:predicted CopG family antitoxin